MSLDDVALERFWRNVDVRGDSECWPWLGTKMKKRDDRGQFSLNGKNVLAPRIMLTLAKGESPAGKPLACHDCDNPNCVNPAHLWWGDYSENALDASTKGRLRQTRVTHCPKGHPYAGENLAITKRGGRKCRACARAFTAAWRAKGLAGGGET